MNLGNGSQQPGFERDIVWHLVLWHPDNDHAEQEFVEILLVFEAAVDGDEDVEGLLGESEEGAVFELILPHFVNRLCLMFGKQRLHSRIYTLINEDAHSMSCWLAKSSTAVACSREMKGYRARNSSIDSPPSRKSIRLWTGTRVFRKQGAPLMRAASTQTTFSRTLLWSAVMPLRLSKTLVRVQASTATASTATRPLNGGGLTRNASTRVSAPRYDTSARTTIHDFSSDDSRTRRAKTS